MAGSPDHGPAPGALRDRLASLGVFPIEVPLPFPQVPSVNAYLLRGPECILIDAGIATEEAWAAVSTGLASLGLSARDIAHIFLSHGHIDHYGLVRRIADGSGAAIHIQSRDLSKIITGYIDPAGPSAAAYLGFFRRMGVPEDTISFLAALYQGSLQFAVPVGAAEEIREGERLPVRDRDLRALCFPGHTPGTVCFYDRTNRILFSGDHLLPRISPNPILEINPDGGTGPAGGNKFKGLVEYLRSLDRVEALDAEVVLPGHGPPMTGHRGLIAKLRRFYDHRQDRILAALEGGPRTPFDLTRAVFPRVREFDVFLAFSEVIGNLEVLEERGRIAWEGRDDGPDSIARCRLIR